jgi:hypothetical protein
LSSIDVDQQRVIDSQPVGLALWANRVVYVTSADGTVWALTVDGEGI